MACSGLERRVSQRTTSAGLYGFYGRLLHWQGLLSVAASTEAGYKARFGWRLGVVVSFIGLINEVD